MLVQCCSYGLVPLVIQMPNMFVAISMHSGSLLEHAIFTAFIWLRLEMKPTECYFYIKSTHI